MKNGQKTGNFDVKRKNTGRKNIGGVSGEGVWVKNCSARCKHICIYIRLAPCTYANNYLSKSLVFQKIIVPLHPSFMQTKAGQR
jgi:hypothetical protein